ncbi:MAG: DUF4388 domain-containing protein [Nitrospirota bacterium]
MDIPFKGDLRDFSLIRVLQYFNAARASGTLSVTAPDFKKNIYIKGGEAIFASSTLTGDRLGEMLVKAGKISDKELADTAALIKVKSKRLGAILVELGYITPDELFWGVKYQVKEIMLSLFGLEYGTYEFCEGCMPGDEVITLKMKMQDLINEGLNRTGSIGHINDEKPDIGPAAVNQAQDNDQPENENMLKARVDELFERLKRLGPAEILEINERSTSEDVKRSYYKYVRIFHPDIVFNSHDADIKEKINAIFDSLTKSYHLLRDDEKRQAYFRAGGKLEGEGGSTHDVIIQEQIKRGIEEFRKKNYLAAVDIFRWITREDPKKHKVWSYLSLALSMIPRRLKEAEEILLEAIRLEPMNSEYHSDLGNIYLKAGLKKRATNQFEKALRLDSGNVKAREGLERINLEGVS